MVHILLIYFVGFGGGVLTFFLFFLSGNGGTGFVKKKWRARPPKPIPKISDQDTYRVNAILLNKNTFRITEVNNGRILFLSLVGGVELFLILCTCG